MSPQDPTAQKTQSTFRMDYSVRREIRAYARDLERAAEGGAR